MKLDLSILLLNYHSGMSKLLFQFLRNEITKKEYRELIEAQTTLYSIKILHTVGKEQV